MPHPAEDEEVCCFVIRTEYDKAVTRSYRAENNVHRAELNKREEVWYQILIAHKRQHNR